ncbi:hypothetical protein KTC92_09085 [Clostridium sp. CM027]|uniref:hypothetical protein n=1 Tax=Clostridium sp. CM027 TaxID=2849865 RepID=UPI001C6E8E75|nr:hypothetical protein [Clostridium sp. CM027]MBW9145429.1 hypothetical protein [Clostridium sp. CM027]UVE39409.1 hypothetical protein KTC92_09085 [Clostridium sp. CM027]
MFIAPPNNFNQIPMWDSVPVFSEPPMAPIPKFGTDDNTRERPAMPTPDNNQHREMPPVSPIVDNPLYNQGWLSTQIGKYIKVEFLIGTGMWVDREGILKEVGISFIVIQESGSNDLVMCDIFSIRFVRIFKNQSKCTDNYEKQTKSSY